MWNAHVTHLWVHCAANNITIYYGSAANTSANSQVDYILKAFGGGVIQQSTLLPAIRKNVLTQLGGYFDVVGSQTSIGEYIVYPGLANSSGIMGAIAMARLAIEKGTTVN